MSKLDAVALSKLLGRTKNIRNVCLVSHVGQGKTSFVKDIVDTTKHQDNQAGSDTSMGNIRGDLDEDDLSIYDDDGGDSDSEDELSEKKKERIDKTTCTSVQYEVKEDDVPLISDCNQDSRDFLITLIDPTGHVDNNSEVTSALRVTDGCIVIADCVTGMGSATEDVMRLAFADQTRPVLLLNRLDLSIDNLELEPEQLYDVLAKCVWTYNKIVEVYGRSSYKVDPSKGSVAFGSGLQGWAFTLHEFARMYTAKFKIDFTEIKEKLWGDNFYNTREKKWSTKPGPRDVRGFLQFVLNPIYTVFNVCKNNGRDDILKFAVTMDFSLTPAEKLVRRDELLKVIMRKWLPAGRTLLNLMVFHLPSPVTAQAKKTELLYDGDLTDEAAIAMKECSPEGGLVMYVSRLVPSMDKNKMYAFGRIFSGTVCKRQQVYIKGPVQFAGVRSGTSEEGTIESVCILYNGQMVEMDSVPCGNVCGVLGIEKHIVKSATISTLQKSQTIKPLRFTVQPVVNMAVEPKNPKDLPQLMDGLRHLERLDPRLEVEVSKTGEVSIWGVNELHTNQCLEELRENLGRVQIKTRGPYLPYRETVTSKSIDTVRIKSPNGRNLFVMDAEILPDGCVRDIDQGKVTPSQDVRERALYLDKKYKIDLTFAKKIWCFGPEGQGPNLLMDCIKGELPKHTQAVEPTVIAGFQWVTKKGVLCEEQMRGVRYNILEMMIDVNESLRTNKEILPVVVQALQAAALSAKPRLMQPIFKVEIQCPESVSPEVFDVITNRQGRITKERSVKDWEIYYMEANLPVVKAYGVEKELLDRSDRAATMTQCVFDHWETLPGSPLDYRSKITAIIRQIRKRKGLDPEVPTVEDFL